MQPQTDMNAKARQEQLEKHAKIRGTPFQKLSSKHFDLKLDLFAADVNNFVQSVDNAFKGITKRNSENDLLLKFFIATAIKSGWFSSDDGFRAAFTDFVDTQNGLRALATGEAVALQDRLTVNLTGYKDGEVFSEISVKNYAFTLNLSTLIPALENVLLTMTVGEVRKVENITFPEDYHNAELAGKSFTYDLEILSAKRNVLVENQEARENLITKIRTLGYNAENVESLSLEQLEAEYARLKAEAAVQ